MHEVMDHIAPNGCERSKKKCQMKRLRRQQRRYIRHCCVIQSNVPMHFHACLIRYSANAVRAVCVCAPASVLQFAFLQYTYTYTRPRKKIWIVYALSILNLSQSVRLDMLNQPKKKSKFEFVSNTRTVDNMVRSYV